MHIVALVIIAALASRWYANKGTGIPLSSTKVGKPAQNKKLLPANVPLGEVTPGTEAAYYLDPIEYVPAFGEDIFSGTFNQEEMNAARNSEAGTYTWTDSNGVTHTR